MYALRFSGSKGCTGASLSRLRNEPRIVGWLRVQVHARQRGPSGKTTCQMYESHRNPVRVVNWWCPSNAVMA
jgi:hypothetical protein